MRRTAYTATTTATPSILRSLIRSTVTAITTGSLIVTAAGVAAAAPHRDSSPDNVIAALAAEIAQADQLIANLRGDVAGKRQSVNRAIVDVQTARNAATAADGAIKVSEAQVSKANKNIEAAQAAADTAVRGAYQQANTSGALIDTLGGKDPGSALESASTLRIIADKKQAALADLTKAKNTAVASRGAAKAAKVQADAATASATARKQSAVDSVTDTLVALNSAEADQAKLGAKRDLAQQALDRAKQASTKSAQQQVYAQYVVDEQQAQAVTPATPAAPAPAAAAADTAAPAVPAAPAAPATGTAAAAGTSNPTDVARGFAENIVGQAASLLGIGAAPAAAAAPAASTSTATTVATSASGQIQSAAGMSGSQAIEAVVARAMSVIGVQYAWGGGTAYGATQGVRDGGTADSFGDYNRIGFDCSGFMAYAFAAVGIALPKYSGYQYSTGNHVPISQLKRGDMVFRGPGGSQHVALYLGNNQIIESPQSGGAVRVAQFDSSTWLSSGVRVINS